MLKKYDIDVLKQIIIFGEVPTYKQLANKLKMSQSTIHKSIHRLIKSRLITEIPLYQDGRTLVPIEQNCVEFFNACKYFYPEGENNV
jgi:hypothetical protein